MLLDDEKAMIIIMKRLLSKIDGIAVSGSFLRGADALKFVGSQAVDVAFVDIQMADGHGVERARQMKAQCPGLQIVFVTSHKDYALDAFEVGAVDYLVKPVSLERLKLTISRLAGNRNAAVATTENSTWTPDAAAAKLTVKGLGGLTAHSRHGDVKWMSGKSAELFAYLLIQRDKGAPRDQILEDLFDGVTNRHTNTYLNTAVYQLRKMLKQHGVGASVVSYNKRYKLRPETVEAGFIVFEERIGEIGEITDSNYKLACEIDKLYAGDLFGDMGYLWSTAEKERLSSLYRRFSCRLGTWLLEHGHLEPAYPVVGKLAARFETDEEANALLLRLYAASRDRRSLITHYGKYASTVQQELGLPPGAEIARLFHHLKEELENG